MSVKRIAASLRVGVSGDGIRSIYPQNNPLINVMETLKKQFNVEINVLNVNRGEGRVFGGFLRVFEGVFEGGFGILSHLFQH